MSNENYVNHYVEILTSTMTDAVIRNISLQANGKISESVIAEQQSRIDKLNSEVKSYTDNLNGTNEQYRNTIEGLQNQVNELNGMKAEYENIKHQANHVDTFRSELIRERELHQQTRNDYDLKIKELNGDYDLKIKELNEKIEYLQLTPAKRKKIDDSKITTTVEVTEEPLTLFNIDTTIKDGGSF
jgi:chromosome segregation ATPase